MKDGTSYEKVRDEIEKDLGISDNTHTDLRDELMGPNFFDEYRIEKTKRLKDDAYYMDLLSSYNLSIFQKFEKYRRTEFDLVQDVIRFF